MPQASIHITLVSFQLVRNSSADWSSSHSISVLLSHLRLISSHSYVHLIGRTGLRPCIAAWAEKLRMRAFTVVKTTRCNRSRSLGILAPTKKTAVNRIAVLYQACDPPAVDGVEKPRKPTGYRDS